MGKMERGEGGGFIGGLGRRWDGKTREIGKVEFPVSMDMESFCNVRGKQRKEMISCWARIGKCLMGQVFPNKNDSIPIFKIRKLKQ